MTGFGMAMALFGATPLLFVYWWSARPLFRERLAETEADPAGVIRRYRRRTLLLTLVPAVLFAAWAFGAGHTLPEAAAGWFAFAVFHFAWWLGVAPLLQRGGKLQPGLPGDLTRPSAATLPGVRSASLASRDERDFLPTWWWTLPIAIFAIGLGVIGWRVAQGSFDSSAALATAIVMPLFALSFLVSYGWWARHTAGGPQDLSGAVDPEALARAYDGFRRFLVRGIFFLMTASIALFMGAAVAILLTEGSPQQGQIGGLLGGIGGSLVGGLGAVFGTIASLRRMKLDRIRRHGSADPTTPRTTPAGGLGH